MKFLVNVLILPHKVIPRSLGYTISNENWRDHMLYSRLIWKGENLEVFTDFEILNHENFQTF